MEIFQALQQGFVNASVAIGLMAIIVLTVVIVMSEEVRQLTIRILSVLAGIAVLAIIVVALYRFIQLPPVQQADAFQVLTGQEILNNLIPFLVVMGILAILIAFLPPLQPLGTGVINLVKQALYLYTRRKYLAALLKIYNTQVNSLVLAPNLATQTKIGEWLKKPQESKRILITGVPGAGKSTLIKQILVSLATQAIQDNSLPIPVFIDLDFVTELKLPFLDKYHRFTAYAENRYSVLLANWMLWQEGEQGRIWFLLDGSISLIESLSQQARNELFVLIHYYRTCTFFLALPLQAEPIMDPYSFERVSLETLSNTQIKQVLDNSALECAVELYAQIEREPSWFTLIRTPFMLSRVVRYRDNEGKLPVNLVDLFRKIVYPHEVTSNSYLETSLAKLAFHMIREERQIIAEKELLEEIGLSPATIRRLAHLNILTILKDARNKTWVRFNHTLLAAFFVALGWRDRSIPSPEDENFLEFIKRPLINEALVFFNNLISDPAQFDTQIMYLADRGDLFSLILATNCLLARPQQLRPTILAQRIGEGLVKLLADYDDESVHKAWVLLEHWLPEQRLDIYSRVLIGMREQERIRVLTKIASLSTADMKTILWHADKILSQDAAIIWLRIDRATAQSELVTLYRSGPSAKRYMAVEFMGYLPAELIETDLVGWLNNERDGQMRVTLLETLHSCGYKNTLRLFHLIKNPDEFEKVRICAAEILAEIDAVELQNEETIFEIVRTLRGNLPTQAEDALKTLLERLRQVVPELVRKTEVAINPYVDGPPISRRELFYGRDKALQDLINGVQSGDYVLVHGARRIGKTSLLVQLWQSLKTEANLSKWLTPIFLSLEGLEWNTVFVELMSNIVDQGEFTLQHPSDTEGYTYFALKKNLKQASSQLKQSKGKSARLVLLLDEIDKIIEYPLVVQGQIREVLQSNADWLSVVVCGVHAEPKWKGLTSPFMGLFSKLHLPPLDPNDARRLIVEPVRNYCAYDEDAVTLILQISGCRPLEIQRLCKETVEYVLSTHRDRIKWDDVEHIWRTKLGARSNVLSQIEADIDALLNMPSERALPSDNELNLRLNIALARWKQAIIAQWAGSTTGDTQPSAPSSL